MSDGPPGLIRRFFSLFVFDRETEWRRLLAYWMGLAFGVLVFGTMDRIPTGASIALILAGALLLATLALFTSVPRSNRDADHVAQDAPIAAIGSAGNERRRIPDDRPPHLCSPGVQGLVR